MNIFLNDYFGFCFELNHFHARFNEKMNFQKRSPTPRAGGLQSFIDEIRNVVFDLLSRRWMFVTSVPVVSFLKYLKADKLDYNICVVILLDQ